MTDYPIQERNDQLLKLFLDLGYNARVVGNKNQPKVIIDNQFAISGFVQNRLYHFTTKPFGGTIVKTINLNNTKITRKEVDQLIDSTHRRQLWKIEILSNETDQRLWYLKTENFSPLFSYDNPRFFFDEISAIKCHQYLSEKHQIVCAVVQSQ